MPTESHQLKVFVSSTCFDLGDVRAELRQFLEENGMSVPLSEDPNSPFLVDPLEDSIESCLQNVESSDVIVCIIDRRYGGVINVGQYKELSATHAEILRARDLTKPIFFFIRNYAWQDYEQFRKNEEYDSNWVEKDNNENKKKWFKMVKLCASLPIEGSMSNWCDQFRSSVDLKHLVLKRLLDFFPQYAGASAMLPDHLVRIHFVFKESGTDGSVKGHFRNVGIGPALDIYHGFRIGMDKTVNSRGALREGDNIKSQDNSDYHYEIPKEKSPVLFCEYSNRFGERYLVEVLLAWSDEGYITSGEEKFSPLAPEESIV